MSLFPVYTYFIVLSLLASLFVYQKKTDFYLKLFPPFLLLTFFIEILGNYLSSINSNNIIVYNFFSTFMFCFFFFVVSLIVKRKIAKRIIRLVMVVYAIAAVANIVFFQGMKAFHTTTYAVGCLLIVPCCVYYFLELFRFPQSGPLLLNPAFWICTGILFFYCCGFPLFGMVSLWNNVSKLWIESYTLFVTMVNILLYTLFTIAFICVRTRKYTLLPS